MYTMREVAAVVRELRTQSEMTQAELAIKARVSRSFLADVESGKATVESAKLLNVLQALGYELALRNSTNGEVRS